MQVIQISSVVARDPTELKNIAKTGRGNERGLGTLALNNHVGGHGGTVPDKANFGTCLVAQLQDAMKAVHGTDHPI